MKQLLITSILLLNVLPLIAQNNLETTESRINSHEIISLLQGFMNGQIQAEKGTISYPHFDDKTKTYLRSISEGKKIIDEAKGFSADYRPAWDPLPIIETMEEFEKSFRNPKPAIMDFLSHLTLTDKLQVTLISFQGYERYEDLYNKKSLSDEQKNILINNRRKMNIAWQSKDAKKINETCVDKVVSKPISINNLLEKAKAKILKMDLHKK